LAASAGPTTKSSRVPAPWSGTASRTRGGS